METKIPEEDLNFFGPALPPPTSKPLVCKYIWIARLFKLFKRRNPALNKSKNPCLSILNYSTSVSTLLFKSALSVVQELKWMRRFKTKIKKVFVRSRRGSVSYAFIAVFLRGAVEVEKFYFSLNKCLHRVGTLV